MGLGHLKAAGCLRLQSWLLSSKYHRTKTHNRNHISSYPNHKTKIREVRSELNFSHSPEVGARRCRRLVIVETSGGEWEGAASAFVECEPGRSGLTRGGGAVSVGRCWRSGRRDEGLPTSHKMRAWGRGEKSGRFERKERMGILQRNSVKYALYDLY